MGIDLIEMDPGTSFPLHTHSGAHVLYVLDGVGTVTIDGVVHPTKPGDCYFIQADEPHAVGAVERHRLLSIGLPHRTVDDPQRMHVVHHHAEAVGADGAFPTSARVRTMSSTSEV